MDKVPEGKRPPVPWFRAAARVGILLWTLRRDWRERDATGPIDRDDIVEPSSYNMFHGRQPQACSQAAL